MRSNRVLCVLLLCVLFVCGSVYAKGSGSTSAEFLTLAVGGRGAALAGAMTAVSDDVDALYWNPAGIAHLSKHQISFAYNKWIEDIYHGFVGVATKPYPWGSVGVSCIYLGMPEIMGYDASGNKTGNFSVNDMACAVSYAKKIAAVAVGGSLKFVKQTIDNVTAESFACDVGAQMNIFDALMLGAVVQNIHSEHVFAKEKEKLPVRAKFGAAYTYDVFARPCTLVAEYDRRIYEERDYVSGGFEYDVIGPLSVRAGYITNRDLGSGVTGGIGFEMGMIKLDYGMTEFGIFDFTHTISLSIKFDEEQW
jgi:hypothetical protein